jgi:thiol:disulfide interchange protein DsbC
MNYHAGIERPELLTRSIDTGRTMKERTFVLTALLLMMTTSADALVARWYSPNQVQQGMQIFERKCAGCHGDRAEGDPQWRRPDAEGDYPPPPLNGSAYAWRYSLDELRERVRIGRKRDGQAVMKRRLSEAEIDAVIAYFQSTWDDITYVLWQSRQPPKASQQDAIFPGTYWLRQHLSASPVKPGRPMKTPVPGIREVRVRDDYIYLSEDGRYAFTGRMIDLSDGTDMTRLSEAMYTREQLDDFAPNHIISYPANVAEKGRLTIFTDTSCGYCRKMHREVPELRAHGITVQFIAYPRRGEEAQSHDDLARIWCSDNGAGALENYFETDELPSASDRCQRPGAVVAGYRLGNRIGISGTPLLILPNGERMKGYNGVEDILEELKIPGSAR